MKMIGLNIQFPISNLILEGKKVVETRTYPLPEKYLNQPLLFIETPGKKGDFKARIVGLITFSGSIEYSSKHSFYKDTKSHLVTPDSPWAWKDKAKYGWRISRIQILQEKYDAPHPRGIIFTKPIEISSKQLSSLKEISLE